MKRLADSNHETSREVAELGRQSREDAIYMRYLAEITMVFLPLTAVSVSLPLYLTAGVMLSRIDLFQHDVLQRRPDLSQPDPISFRQVRLGFPPICHRSQHLHLLLLVESAQKAQRGKETRTRETNAARVSVGEGNATTG